MNKNEEDLIELLKHRCGEEYIYYSPLFGECTVTINEYTDNIRIHAVKIYPETISNIVVNRYGYIYGFQGECMIYPSESERDWKKWADKNITKYKTWSDVTNQDVILESLSTTEYINKIVLATMKIKYLIDTAYDGPVDYRKSKVHTTYIIIPNIEYDNKSGEVISIDYVIKLVNSGMAFANILRFNTKKAAEEFLSYEENRILVKEYFNIYERNDSNK